MRQIVTFVFAIALLPAIAAAQQKPPAAQAPAAQMNAPPSLPTLSPTLSTSSGSLAPAWVQGQPHIGTMLNAQAMQRQVSQMYAMQLQTRSAILSALTPAHRTFLSQLVGDLAVSPNPDAAGAARQLNATLSSGEGRAVVTAEQTQETRMLSAMQNVVARSISMHATASARATASGFAGSDDAGQILLRYAAMGMLPMPNMVFGPGRQPHR